MEYGNTRNYCFRDNASKKNIKLKIIMHKNSTKRSVQKYRVKIGAEIENVPMEGIAVEYFTTSIDTGNNGEKC